MASLQLMLNSCCPAEFPFLYLCLLACRKADHALKLEHSAERRAEHVQRVLADAAYARAQASSSQLRVHLS